MKRLFQGIQDEACMRRPADPPANDPTGEGIDDEGHINEAAPGRDISEIADPKPVRRRCAEVPVHLVHRARRAWIWHSGAHFLAANNTRQAHRTHQTLDGAAGDSDALAVHLPPDFGRAIDPEVVIPDALDHRLEGAIPLHTRRGRLWLADALGMLVIAGRGNRQDPADRLDPILTAMIFNEGDHVFDRRSNSACAK